MNFNKSSEFSAPPSSYHHFKINVLELHPQWKSNFEETKCAKSQDGATFWKFVMTFKPYNNTLIASGEDAKKQQAKNNCAYALYSKLMETHPEFILVSSTHSVF